MMTLKQVKDWLKTKVEADCWKIGVYDNTKDKTVCVRNLASNKNKLAIGGLSNTIAFVKGISIVVHWTKNPDESERIAQSIYDLFYGKDLTIDDFRVVKCDMRNDEPVSVGVDNSGIYEYVIEIWITYEKLIKEV